eukprot:Clim_evm13s224 gene=Clim_evmTU13s224
MASLIRNIARASRASFVGRPTVTGAARVGAVVHGSSQAVYHARRFQSTDAAELPANARDPGLDIDNVEIVESTLREGEQFSTAFFSTEDKIMISTMLDSLGVDYIELTTPMASTQSMKDCEAVAKLGLKAKILTHTRCHMSDVKLAVESGVDGVNVYMATSNVLRQYSHGKGIDHIIDAAREVIEYCQSNNVEIRFSCEDTFRSNLEEITRIYTAVDQLGVDRIGLADTVGVATPLQVYNTVKWVRERVGCDIEYHTHDDTGCCIANALLALQAGATHIDTCVLGIGERNGITPLGGFLGRLYTIDKEKVRRRFNLKLVPQLERVVSEKVGISVPFNNCVTGSTAFTHKAGVHSKAVMQNPGSYEVLDPDDFGVNRNIQVAHRLTGWNAVQKRAQALGLALEDKQVKAATLYIKNLADRQAVSSDDLDAVLRAYQDMESLPADEDLDRVLRAR